MPGRNSFEGVVRRVEPGRIVEVPEGDAPCSTEDTERLDDEGVRGGSAFRDALISSGSGGGLDQLFFLSLRLGESGGRERSYAQVELDFDLTTDILGMFQLMVNENSKKVNLVSSNQIVRFTHTNLTDSKPAQEIK